MFLKYSQNDLYPVISDYLKVLIPSFITYLVTRYSLARPRKYEIREKQFNLVYLPLYRLTKQLISDTLSRENLIVYIRKADKIFYKNYQYVFPKTFKLFNRVKEEASKPHINTYHITVLEYQIESDYEKLKHELGYPTDSAIDFFKRLSILDKTLYAINLALGLLGVVAIANCIISFSSGDILNSLWAFGAGCIIFFTLYIISYPKRH